MCLGIFVLVFIIITLGELSEDSWSKNVLFLFSLLRIKIIDFSSGDLLKLLIYYNFLSLII